MPPTLALRTVIRKQGFWMLGVSFAGLLVGAVLLGIGLVTGFVLCIAIPILLMAPFGMLWGLVLMIYPDIQLGHLGDGARRDQALAHIDSELRDPRTMYQPTKRGYVCVTPTWVVLHADDALVVEPRRDILLVYKKTTTRRRGAATEEIKIRSRAKDYTCPTEHPENDWLVGVLSGAAPWAIFGYRPDLADVDRRVLAQQVDQRAMSLPQG